MSDQGPVIQYWRALAFQALNERDLLAEKLKAYEDRKNRRPEESWAAANLGLREWLLSKERRGKHPLQAKVVPTAEELRLRAELAEPLPEHKRWKIWRRRKDVPFHRR